MVLDIWLPVIQITGYSDYWSFGLPVIRITSYSVET